MYGSKIAVCCRSLTAQHCRYKISVRNKFLGEMIFGEMTFRGYFFDEMKFGEMIFGEMEYTRVVPPAAGLIYRRFLLPVRRGMLRLL